MTHTPVALITGGSKGIGAATCRRLSEAGYRVVNADIVEPLGPTGDHIEWFRTDIASDSDWSALSMHMHSNLGRCDVVVNNAYSIVRVPSHEMTPTEWTHQLEVVVGQVHRSLYYLHDLLMASESPSIVNISSVHAVMSDPLHSAYAAGKGAIESVTRQLAVEYGPHIRVNAVAPGAIETEAWAGIPQDVIDAVSAKTPMGRIGSPDDIAGAISFLVSPEASFITGTTLVVDGGWTITKG
jgi:NAD(P)-dependent dehydrogenase (short-subunit alcohol dehydrogenase family)